MQTVATFEITIEETMVCNGRIMTVSKLTLGFDLEVHHDCVAKHLN